MKLVHCVLGFSLVVALASCSKSEAATESGGATEPGPTPASGSAHETANYKITLEKVGSYKKGEKGVVNVVLQTKGPYHINKEYPYKVACQDPAADGVSYPKKVVRRADGKFEENKGVMPIPFVSSKAGKVKVGGMFSLSVCTEKNCLMDKRPVELEVSVD